MDKVEYRRIETRGEWDDWVKRAQNEEAKIEIELKQDNIRVQVILSGYIATLQEIQPNWNDKQLEKYNEMIANMEDTLLLIKNFT